MQLFICLGCVQEFLVSSTWKELNTTRQLDNLIFKLKFKLYAQYLWNWMLNMCLTISIIGLCHRNRVSNRVAIPHHHGQAVLFIFVINTPWPRNILSFEAMCISYYNVWQLIINSKEQSKCARVLFSIQNIIVALETRKKSPAAWALIFTCLKHFAIHI
jgi:hypothetical protein